MPATAQAVFPLILLIIPYLIAVPLITLERGFVVPALDPLGGVGRPLFEYTTATFQITATFRNPHDGSKSTEASYLNWDQIQVTGEHGEPLSNLGISLNVPPEAGHLELRLDSVQHFEATRKLTLRVVVANAVELAAYFSLKVHTTQSISLSFTQYPGTQPSFHAPKLPCGASGFLELKAVVEASWGWRSYSQKKRIKIPQGAPYLAVEYDAGAVSESHIFLGLRIAMWPFLTRLLPTWPRWMIWYRAC